MRFGSTSLIVLAALLVFLGTPLPAITQIQAPSHRPDSTTVFGSIEPTTNPELKTSTFKKAFGLNVMISTNGFGLGAFYRRQFSDVISAAIDLAVSEAKDEDEKEVTDIYGRPITIGKVNRFLVMPIYLSIERRLFKDDILDNFRPYLTGAVGPSLIYVFPYNEEYFSALGKGSLRYTFGGYIGAGAYFGSDPSSLLGLNLRYYYIPYYAGLENLVGVNKTEFGGIYISLSFGSVW
jgi:hypothetical protein